MYKILIKAKNIMKNTILESKIFKGFKLSVDYERNSFDKLYKHIYMVYGNSERIPIFRMNQFAGKVNINSEVDALSFVSIRTSPILCDSYSTLCFGEFCLEVVPRENLKYNFTFGDLKTYKEYISTAKLFPLKKNVSHEYQNYPCVIKTDVFIVKRLIMGIYRKLYEVEEHVSKNGEIILEKRVMINTTKNVGRDVYFFIEH